MIAAKHADEILLFLRCHTAVHSKRNLFSTILLNHIVLLTPLYPHCLLLAKKLQQIGAWQLVIKREGSIQHLTLEPKSWSSIILEYHNYRYLKLLFQAAWCHWFLMLVCPKWVLKMWFVKFCVLQVFYLFSLLCGMSLLLIAMILMACRCKIVRLKFGFLSFIHNLNYCSQRACTG